MKYQEMVDRIKQHHPHLREKEIRQLVNDAQDEFSERTELTKAVADISIIAGQRYYALDAKIGKINKVYIDDLETPRLLGDPVIDDTTGE